MLPSRTTTFLFTDIEGSTALLRRLGDRYPEVLGTHRMLIRAAVQRAGGREVDTQGDAFFFTFPGCGLALKAAVDIQTSLAQHDWPEGADLTVRLGVHSGEVRVRPEGYVGMDVHRAARIAAAAHGGQIIVSAVVRELARTSSDPSWEAAAW